MGGGKSAACHVGKGETKQQGFFLCPALSQSPGAVAYRPPWLWKGFRVVTSNAELLGLGMLVACALAGCLLCPPTPALRGIPPLQAPSHCPAPFFSSMEKRKPGIGEDSTLSTWEALAFLFI